MESQFFRGKMEQENQKLQDLIKNEQDKSKDLLEEIRQLKRYNLVLSNNS